MGLPRHEITYGENFMISLSRLLPGLLLAAVFAVIVACGGETVIRVVETVIVTEKGDTIIITEKGDTIIETVIVTEKGDTVVIEKEVLITPTPAVALPTALPEKINIPNPGSSKGALVMIPRTVPPGVGINSSQASEEQNYWGVSEGLFRVVGDNDGGFWLAESWSMSSDGKQVTVKIRSGVQFHGGWGELTAFDVAWSTNDTNSAVTPESIHGQAGDLAAFLDETIALDDRTLVLNFNAPEPRWNTLFFNQSRAGGTFNMYSKKAYDEKGEDWLRDNIISTGPYEVVTWNYQDRAELRATETHWAKAASVETLILLDIPESATRVAMMKTGEADWSEMNVRDIRPLAEAGFTVLSTGNLTGMPVNFAGNYWETTGAKDGVTLAQPTMRHDIPWVGNPFRPDDADNPAGIDDMEQARMVRTALSYSIDRDLVSESVYGGLATPYYIGMFHINSPEWQAKWVVPYDVAKAESLLDQAGYPRDKNGVRFEMPLYGFSSNRDWAETADIVSGFFDAVGVKTSVIKSAYAIVRPSLVGRTNTTPATQSCRSDLLVPWDWVRGEEETSLTRGGFGCHMESPEILRIVRAVASAGDRAERITLNNELAQYMFDQALKVGVVGLPSLSVANPNSIADWPMTLGDGVSNSPENIIEAR